jgi:peptidoglycan DL-endopeptidase CwlO
MSSAPTRRRAIRSVVLRLLSLVTAAVATVLLLTTAPAVAAPGGDASGEEAGVAPTLLEQLEVTNRAYVEAKAVSDASKARQAQIQEALAKAEKRLAELANEVGATANAAYRGSKFNLTASLLEDGRSSEDMLRGITTVSYLAWRDDRQLREFVIARKEYTEQLKALEAEVRLQEEQTRQMEKRKNEAVKALSAAGNGGVVNGVPVPTPTATQAPRGANGTWPGESATVDDPTTSGRITPRTFHALTEARKAGFNRFTGCFRPGDRFEHPKGRACDFAANKNGFGGAATGDDRNYGDRLAGWFVGNADRLGVLYVIWYRQIWTPAAKWHSYGSAGGDPASDHTNHVHLSIL